ncbi:unnamed protein product [Mytilus edulis]|uniref:Uncharacterized protein n=1 Tax=Mytilus edulis TaxID=6550 RepID=A0A8S3V700_MYTED|nr:unnamed protein product [Mytilus edulis]
MKDDAVKKCLMTDALIMKFGERLYERMDLEEHTPNTIGQKLRHLERHRHLKMTNATSKSYFLCERERHLKKQQMQRLKATCFEQRCPGTIPAYKGGGRKSQKRDLLYGPKKKQKQASIATEAITVSVPQPASKKPIVLNEITNPLNSSMDDFQAKMGK